MELIGALLCIFAYVFMRGGRFRLGMCLSVSLDGLMVDAFGTGTLAWGRADGGSICLRSFACKHVSFMDHEFVCLGLNVNAKSWGQMAV